MILSDLRKLITHKFTEAGINQPAFEADALILFILNKTRAYFYTDACATLPSDTTEKIMELADIRCTGYPLQYIFGKTSFMNIELKVTPDVLIPRSDTEILVEKALEYILTSNIKQEIHILDMCTGSGCIGIALAKELLVNGIQDIKITLADISPECLKIAQYNSKMNAVDKYTEFICSDLFNGFSNRFYNYYDLILSNPPYIPTKVIETLAKEVKDYEPHLALDGGNDGLDYYKKLANDSKKFLRKNGRILFEIGYDQEITTKNILHNAGYDPSSIEVFKDYNSNPRVITGSIN